MPGINYTGVKFQEAADHLRQKLPVPTAHWDDMVGAAHAKGFTVAGATKMAIVKDFHAFDTIAEKHGWSYKGKRGWRSRVIYDTNLRTANAAGRWQQFERNKETRPFLQYFTVGDERVRPQHREWNMVVLPIDDDWWTSHYPPNGWGCRCGVRSLSPRELRRRGLTVSEAPAIKLSERVNTATGEVYGEVPQGIDVGWDYNVGKAWLGPDIAFGEALMGLPPSLRNQALQEAVEQLTPKLGATFAPWVNGMLDRKQSLGEIRTVGYLSPKAIDGLIAKGEMPSTAVITISDRDVMHLLRDAKKGKHLAADMIRSLPDHITSPHAILWDKRDPALVYVWDLPGNAKTGKLIVRVNYKMKGRGQDGKRHAVVTNSIRTGGMVELSDLKASNVYEVIDGRL
jgi:SPP1 gp7 family putative phage head morphogenesis protein